jgi:hypothetical protein
LKAVEVSADNLIVEVRNQGTTHYPPDLGAAAMLDKNNLEATR